MKYNIVDCSFLPCLGASPFILRFVTDVNGNENSSLRLRIPKFPYLSLSLHPALLTSFGRAHVSHSNSRRFEMCALFVLAHFHSWKKFHSRSTFPLCSVCLTTLPDSSDIETRSHSAASHRPGPQSKQQLISLGSICVWNKEMKKGAEKRRRKNSTEMCFHFYEWNITKYKQMSELVNEKYCVYCAVWGRSEWWHEWNDREFTVM